VASVCAAQDLAAFWERGKVRELFSSGLATEEAQMQEWAGHGVNCLTGAKPELAHKCGMKTRTWFTMNLISSSMDEDRRKAMAAINRDGTYRRPYDPLFPTVANNWTACVNSPAWREYSEDQFRRKARDDYDGCHIDYASHYEPCFCEHCKAKWLTWAAARGLVDMDLEQATDAADLRTRMLLREFRIACVIEFLTGVRNAAREIKPGFATDGTWHQDNGSVYQWAYGDHFDLMCIEGTTYRPFPPQSTQILWLKLAHALSRRDDRRPVAMSVTYHLLPDEQGTIHHGRMAPDRVRVALAEIFSQGAVSWLGLGGPKTGNLLREHQDLTKAYFEAARDLEPQLVRNEDIAEIGLVFSARSFLLTGSQRTQLYAFGQAMMKAHVPFKIISDVGLEAADLEGLSGVVLLSARALSDAGCKAIESYARDGGQVLIMGSDAAMLSEVWEERSPRPSFATPPVSETDDAQGIVTKTLGKGECHYWLEDPFAGRALGAAQFIALNQEKPATLAIEGWSKASDVSGGPDSNYSLYVDLHHHDGSPMWGRVATFATGTHDWEFSRTLIKSDRPFKSANIHMLFRSHRGTVWFRDVKFGVWNEAEKKIEKNMLADRFTLADGETYSAAPGENAPTGSWGPYRDGYEVENMLDMGLWVKMASTRGLTVEPMTGDDPLGKALLLDAIKPLRAAEPTLTIEGAGADKVYGDLSRAGDRVTLQLINYNADLHPDLPELEQQSTEKSIPATDLSITLRLPGLDLDPESVSLIAPEGDPQVSCSSTRGAVQVRLDKLNQYAALVFGVR